MNCFLYSFGKNISFGLLVMLVGFNTFSQSSDTKIFQPYIDLCDSLKRRDFSQLLNVADSGLHLASILNDELHQAIFSNFKGIAFSKKGALDSAAVYFSSASSLYLALGDSLKYARSLANEANLFQFSGRWEKSLDLYAIAADILEGRDQFNLPGIYHNIGFLINTKQNLPEQALIYLNRSAQLAKEADNSFLRALSLREIGDILAEKSEFKTARKSIMEAEYLFDSLGAESKVAAVQISMGSIYVSTDQLDSAMLFFESALKIYKEKGVVSGIISALIHKAEVFLSQGNNDAAISMVEEAEELSIKHNMLNRLVRVYKLMANALKNLDQHESAYRIFEKSVALQDSLFAEEKQKLLISTLANYESDKKEKLINDQAFQLKYQQILIQSSEREKKFFIGLSVILFVSLLLFVVLGQKLREQKRTMAQQSEKLKLAYERESKVSESLEILVEKRTARLVEQHQKLKEYAFANSHEVRAPLTRILGAIHIMKKENLEKEELNQFIGIIAISADELDRIIRKTGETLKLVDDPDKFI